MKKTRKLALVLLIVAFAFSTILCACDDSSNSFVVSFETNGGSTIENVTVGNGETVAEPTAPTKADTTEKYYVFDGWYVGETKYEFSTPVVADLTLSAKWIEKSFIAISFDVNGGSENLQDQKIKEGAGLSNFASIVPSKVGYTFVGWYNGENKVDANTTFTESATLIAHYTANTDTAYVVNHYKQNLADDEYTLAETENKSGTTNEQTSATAKDYSADGYKTANSFEQVTIKADGSAVVNLYYDLEKYSVTWMNGTEELQKDEGLKHGSALPTAPELAKAGYTLSWLNGEDEFTATTVTSNLTLVAKMTANTDTAYVVNHYKQNLADDEYTLAETENKCGTTDGQTSATAKDYSADGYKTANSFEQVTIKADGSAVVNLYYDLEKYSVTWMNGTEELQKDEGLKHGSALPTAPTATKADEGTSKFVFEAWYNGESKFEGIVVTSNLVLNAHFTEYTPCTVHFNASGATVADATYYYGKITLPSDVTKVNYIFEGWYYEETLTTAVDGDNFNRNGDEMTLYAKWRLCSSYVTDNKDGTYTTTAGSVAKVHGEVDSLALKSYSSTFKVLNGQSSGAFGLIFRAGLVGDNAFSADENLYYMVQILPSNGGLQVARNPFTHIGGINANGGSGKTLTDMPSAYQAKFNEYKNNGADLEVTLTIYDFADHFEFYIDGDFAYSYTYKAAELATHTNKGYGVRIGTAFVQCTYTEIEVKDLVKVTFDFDNESADKVCYTTQNGTLSFPADPSKLALDTTIYTFEGWYVGEEKISDSYVFAQDTVVKAKYTETVGNMHYRVTFKFEDEVVDVQSIEENATATAPTLAPITRTIDNTIYTYTFTGWNSGDSAFDFSTPITSATTLTAVYTKTATRNGIAITFDANGKEVYTATTGTSNYSIAGETYESGEITYKVTIDGNGGTEKASQELALIIGLDNSKATGLQSNDAISLKMNIHYGSIYLGYMSGGKLYNVWSYITTNVNKYYPELVTQLKNCRDNKTTITLSFKVKYGPSYFAMYIDDVLFFAYNTEDASTAKIELTDANMTGSEAYKTKFLSIVSGTTYHGIGFVTVQNATTKGGYVLSDVVIKETVE